MGTFQEASPWEPRSQVSGVSRAHNTQHDTQRRRWQHSLRQTPPRVAWRDKNTKRGDPLHNGAAQRETCTSSQPPALHLSMRKEPVGNFGCSPGRSSLQQPHTSGRMEIPEDKYFYLSKGVELALTDFQVSILLLKYRL